MNACGFCRPTHNRDVREHGRCRCDCHGVRLPLEMKGHTERPPGARQPESSLTKRVYMGHGGDNRYVMCSLDDEYVTVEQLAAICGVAAGTMRDQISDRKGHGANPLGELIEGTWMVKRIVALLIIRDRWCP